MQSLLIATHLASTIRTLWIDCFLFLFQFGRKKKKFRGKTSSTTSSKEPEKKEAAKPHHEPEDDDDEEDDDEDGDLSKYKLDVRPRKTKV